MSVIKLEISEKAFIGVLFVFEVVCLIAQMQEVNTRFCHDHVGFPSKFLPAPGNFQLAAREK